MKTQAMNFTENAVQDVTSIINISKTKTKVIYQVKKAAINIKSLATIKNENTILKIISKILKKIIDISAGIVGVIVLIPLTITLYIANKIYGDGGPIFYFQDRIGKDGKIFRMPKYRSMVIDADKKLEEYLNGNEEARKEYKKYKKLKNDPRITKIGYFLRKTSLDEMPQLVLLLTGTMSLVGPRPYLPRETEDMGEYYNIIIKSKPGLTGLWQVRGRSNATFDDRLDLDIIYHNKKSLWVDLKILYKTAKLVLKKEGAV